MASWQQVTDDAPEFAEAVHERFSAHRHHILGTLRRDGSPRLSGIEVSFRDGEIWLGMMPRSQKSLDLRRDPRFALHSGTEDPPAEPPDPGYVVDAKIAGTATAVDDDGMRRKIAGGQGGGPPDFHLFRVDLSEITLISIGDPADHLSIQTWTTKGLKVQKRY